ncbi:hypothetical protein [Luteimonas aquatica]|uniref:hypothetical protein n=1 Tax=Luteimonas aquatica TaxID=450364 RepID=UPI001F56EC2F|nr:hypothetical protein [Luteimonas aquatica]
MNARAPAVALLLCGLAAAGQAQAQRLQARAAAPSAPCVQVRIGEEEAGRLDCLNRMLQDAVQRTAPLANVDGPDAQRVPIALGQPTPAALRQRYGDAYGRSLTPQRPQRMFPSNTLRPPGAIAPGR